MCKCHAQMEGARPKFDSRQGRRDAVLASGVLSMPMRRSSSRVCYVEDTGTGCCQVERKRFTAERTCGDQSIEDHERPN